VRQSSGILAAIDHMGVAVASLDEAVALYRDLLGLPLVHRETIVTQGVSRTAPNVPVDEKLSAGLFGPSGQSHHQDHLELLNNNDQAA
jgi:methylmalonyl-CoA/ethylmalonyl-CoA epimerase